MGDSGLIQFEGTRRAEMWTHLLVVRVGDGERIHY